VEINTSRWRRLRLAISPAPFLAAIIGDDRAAFFQIGAGAIGVVSNRAEPDDYTDGSSGLNNGSFANQTIFYAEMRSKCWKFEIEGSCVMSAISRCNRAALFPRAHGKDRSIRRFFAHCSVGNQDRLVSRRCADGGILRVLNGHLCSKQIMTELMENKPFTCVPSGSNR